MAARAFIGENYHDRLLRWFSRLGLRAFGVPCQTRAAYSREKERAGGPRLAAQAWLTFATRCADVRSGRHGGGGSRCRTTGRRFLNDGDCCAHDRFEGGSDRLRDRRHSVALRRMTRSTPASIAMACAPTGSVSRVHVAERLVEFAGVGQRLAEELTEEHIRVERTHAS